MLQLLRDRFLVVWLLLVGMTFVTWEAGGAAGREQIDSAIAATFAVLVLAFAKVALVMDNFMGLRNAPVGLRALCGAWLVIVLILLLATYVGVFR